MEFCSLQEKLPLFLEGKHGGAQSSFTVTPFGCYSTSYVLRRRRSLEKFNTFMVQDNKKKVQTFDHNLKCYLHSNHLMSWQSGGDEQVDVILKRIGKSKFSDLLGKKGFMLPSPHSQYTCIKSFKLEKKRSCNRGTPLVWILTPFKFFKLLIPRFLFPKQLPSDAQGFRNRQIEILRRCWHLIWFCFFGRGVIPLSKTHFHLVLGTKYGEFLVCY